MHDLIEELDRALAGDPAAEPELLLLVEDVRAVADRPDTAFAARLDGRMAEGFPEPVKPRRVWRTKFLAIAAPIAATCVVAAVVMSGNDDQTVSGIEATPTEERSAAPESAPDADSSTGAAAPQLAAPATPPAAAGRERVQGPRKVERSAELTLKAAPGDVQDVADQVVRTTQAVGGYVQSSSVATQAGGGEATFVLRVPSARLDAALARLSDLASVESLRQDAQDITASVDSAAERLSEARAERRGLLRAIAAADDEGELRRLRERLRQVRSRIARTEGELNSLRRRADLSTVAVTVRGDASAAGDDEGGAWSPGDALDDAWRVLEISAGVLLVGVAVLLPVALLAGAALAGGRVVRRRRREAALG